MPNNTRSETVGPFELGVNNRRAEYDLVESNGRGEDKRFVRAAVNVDLDKTGLAVRRNGYALAISGTDCHSLWGNATGLYYVDYTTLCSLRRVGATWVSTPLLAGLTPGRPMSYTDIGGKVVFSNGVQLGALSGGALATFGVPAMASAPALSASLGGSLLAGTYQFTFTQRSADGQESAAIAPAAITVAANSTISISGIPALTGGATSTAVYMTEPNSSELMLLVRLTAGQTSYSVSAPPSLGGRCQTLFMAPMPPGQIVRYNNGRLLVASGSMLYYSEPYALALYRPARGFIPFPEPITMIESLPSGFYVSADRTYWVAGDVGGAELAEVLPYRAVLGTSGAAPDGEACWWMSERGQVRADDQGQVNNVQEEAVSPAGASYGASFLREQDGKKHIVSALFGAQEQATVARTYMDAEVIRKETIL